MEGSASSPHGSSAETQFRQAKAALLTGLGAAARVHPTTVLRSASAEKPMDDESRIAEDGSPRGAAPSQMQQAKEALRLGETSRGQRKEAKAESAADTGATPPPKPPRGGGSQFREAKKALDRRLSLNRTDEDEHGKQTSAQVEDGAQDPPQEKGDAADAARAESQFKLAKRALSSRTLAPPAEQPAPAEDRGERVRESSQFKLAKEALSKPLGSLLDPSAEPTPSPDKRAPKGFAADEGEKQLRRDSQFQSARLALKAQLKEALIESQAAAAWEARAAGGADEGGGGTGQQLQLGESLHALLKDVQEKRQRLRRGGLAGQLSAGELARQDTQFKQSLAALLRELQEEQQHQHHMQQQRKSLAEAAAAGGAEGGSLSASSAPLKGSKATASELGKSASGKWSDGQAAAAVAANTAAERQAVPALASPSSSSSSSIPPMRAAPEASEEFPGGVSQFKGALAALLQQLKDSPARPLSKGQRTSAKAHLAKKPETGDVGGAGPPAALLASNSRSSSQGEAEEEEGGEFLISAVEELLGVLGEEGGRGSAEGQGKQGEQGGQLEVHSVTPPPPEAMGRDASTGVQAGWAIFPELAEPALSTTAHAAPPSAGPAGSDPQGASGSGVELKAEERAKEEQGVSKALDFPSSPTKPAAGGFEVWLEQAARPFLGLMDYVNEVFSYCWPAVFMHPAK